MRRKVKVWAGLLCALAVLGLFSTLMLQPQAATTEGTPLARQANVSSLKAAYLDWTADHVANGGDRNVILALNWSKGMSREYTEASGVARLDLVGGSAEVELAGLKPGESWDVWLVENQPGGSALPEPSDRAQRLGRVAADQGRARLTVRLEPGFFERFQADMVVVSRAGTRPEAGVLFGTPDLFQRLYTQGRTRPSMVAGHAPAAPLFGPRLAFATPFDSLDPLVAQGADLFFNETFNGNGRTCGTCHPARNNFTIDPKFIATLPPEDPLFVAEFNPDLAVNFEKPQLMRELGLVLENVDGFTDLTNRFVLRSVQHTLGLRNSRIRQPGSPAPVERLGWGGDGAPLGGTLRDFAVGAINQHLTRKLTRVPDVDFRFPTDQELDAMAAFQLALGRQEDLNLAAMQFTSPVVSRGRDIYNTLSSNGGTVAAGKCSACHGNGGALGIENDNRNFNIGVEAMADHPAHLIAPGVMPKDGGFLRNPANANGFGIGRFNTPTVVEAADSGPFFHNNAVDTIEEAVAFYNSKAFNNSEVGVSFKAADGGIGIQLEATQVESIAAMLRVINALENIRSSAELDQAAYDVKDFDKVSTLLDIASFDTEDAYQVLNERNLHPTAAQYLKLAYQKEREAVGQHSRPRRNELIQEIIMLKEAARADMIVTP
ncbi:MAG TPA: hypothetical protein VG477_13655 [Thermoanaerobaculia bacterium]|nr:hypothetical protein [Thermoanaerobaculia bacterium]